MRPGFRGWFLGRLHVSNMDIKYIGRSISEISVGGEPLDDEKTYKVGTSDYLHRGTGYESLRNNSSEEYHEDYLRDTLEKYLSDPNMVRKAFTQRWIEKELWIQLKMIVETSGLILNNLKCKEGWLKWNLI